MTALEQALTFVLRWEGGYVDHAADQGGATMKGITQQAYDRYRAVEKPDQKAFLKGWLNRIKALREELGVAPDTDAEDASYGDLDGAPDTGFPFSPHIPDLAPGQPLEAWR